MTLIFQLFSYRNMTLFSLQLQFCNIIVIVQLFFQKNCILLMLYLYTFFSLHSLLCSTVTFFSSFWGENSN